MIKRGHDVESAPGIYAQNCRSAYRAYGENRDGRGKYGVPTSAGSRAPVALFIPDPDLGQAAAGKSDFVSAFTFSSRRRALFFRSSSDFAIIRDTRPQQRDRNSMFISRSASNATRNLSIFAPRRP